MEGGSKRCLLDSRPVLVPTWKCQFSGCVQEICAHDFHWQLRSLIFFGWHGRVYVSAIILLFYYIFFIIITKKPHFLKIILISRLRQFFPLQKNGMHQIHKSKTKHFQLSFNGRNKQISTPIFWASFDEILCNKENKIVNLWKLPYLADNDITHKSIVCQKCDNFLSQTCCSNIINIFKPKYQVNKRAHKMSNSNSRDVFHRSLLQNKHEYFTCQIFQPYRTYFGFQQMCCSFSLWHCST